MAKLNAVSPNSDKDWEARQYAHTLTEAEAIKKDPKKLKMAAMAASQMKQEQQEKARAFTRVAKMGKK